MLELSRILENMPHVNSRVVFSDRNSRMHTYCATRDIPYEAYRIKERKDYLVPIVAPILDIVQVTRLVGLFRRLRPDIVLVNQPGPEEAQSILLASRLSGLYTVSILHLPLGIDKLDRKAKFSRLRNFIVSVCSRLASRFIVVSKSGVEALCRDFDVPGEKICVLYPGLPIPKRGRERQETIERPTLLFVGRLVPQKRIDLLIRAAAKVQEKIANVRFLVVGDGPERSKLRELASTLKGGQSVEFVGWQTDTERFYRESHLVVFASLFEGMPIAMIEALSYGIPVLAPPVGGFSEIIQDGYNGFLQDPCATDQFSAAILELLMNRDSQETRKNCLDTFTTFFTQEQARKQMKGILDSWQV